jgi:trimeric autotransporter adhesin
MKNTWLSTMMSVIFALASTSSMQATEIQTSDITSFGDGAGALGFNNSFFGHGAGYSNEAGATYNSFFGDFAGTTNSTGNQNSFFGSSAGRGNTSGSLNSFFGENTGRHNSTGIYNSFLGQAAGFNNTSGGFNVFLGISAGISNTVESNNSAIGAYSNVQSGLTNAAAIGYRSYVSRSDSLVLGGVNGVNGAAAETNVGIGVTNPDRQLTVEGTQAIARFRRYYGTGEAFTRTFAPAFLFERARPTQWAPSDIIEGDYLGKVQFRGRVGGNLLEYGAIAFIASDTSQNGRFSFIDRDLTTERMSILNTGNVGINTIAPLERLHVVGNVRIDGDLIWTDSGAAVPDYVFDPDYRLMGIEQLEQFIAGEKHLPNIPSAAEIKDKGLNMSDFQMKLLEKIEELTLYTVRQAKTIALKDADIADLGARIAALEQIVERMAKNEK